MHRCISTATAASPSRSCPYYNSAIGKLWLERGGTSVTANIRGGGEFGTRWHEAGRLAKKPLSHDDFAAVAARSGAARRNPSGAHRGPRAGPTAAILITNMLTRYPERFGALFCTIPLIDMRRYSKLLAGASWVAEYGDPDKPEDWAFLQTYSAYHQAEPGRRYPADPACHHPQRRPRASGPRPEDGRQAASDGLMKLISMNLPREGTATAKTTRNARRSRRWAWHS